MLSNTIPEPHPQAQLVQLLRHHSTLYALGPLPTFRHTFSLNLHNEVSTQEGSMTFSQLGSVVVGSEPGPL